MQKLHVGGKNLEFKCQDLLVEKWTEIEVKVKDLEKMVQKDVFDGEHII